MACFTSGLAWGDPNAARAAKVPAAQVWAKRRRVRCMITDYRAKNAMKKSELRSDCGGEDPPGRLRLSASCKARGGPTTASAAVQGDRPTKIMIMQSVRC